MRRLLLAVWLSVPVSFLSAGPADTTFFGIQTHFGQGRPDLDSLMTLIHRAGVRAVRDEVYWHEIETVKGTFQFKPEHDAYIHAALARGITPLLILDYGNDLYGGVPKDSAGREAFARYCRAVVGRYAPLGVHHYEIWNEPNICFSGFCPWPSPNPAEYVELLKVVSPAIKAVDSLAVVVGCATSPAEGETSPQIPGIAFITQVFDLGGGAFMDAVSFHQYPIGKVPEDWLVYETTRVRTVAGSIPMWITEIGHHTSTRSDGISDARQAALLARTYLLGRTVNGLRRLSWYDLSDDCSDAANPECRYGILRLDKSPKPAYLALQTALTLTASLPLLSFVESNGVYQARFGSGSAEVTAVWTKTGTALASVAVATEFARLVGMDGTTFRIVSGATSGVSVTAGEEVQYLCSVSGAVTLDRLSVNPGSVILDSLQVLALEVAGEVGGSPVTLNPNLVQWQYAGTGAAVTSSGILSASGTGEGMVVAAYGSARDTVPVRVVAAAGRYLMHSLGATDGWTVTGTNIDASSFSVTRSDTLVASPPGAVCLTYRYAYTGVNPVITLRPPGGLAYPGRIDSLQLSVWGDGQYHGLMYEVMDRDRQLFTTVVRRINWSGGWRTLSSKAQIASGTFDPPATVTGLMITLIPFSAPPVGTVCTGAILVDDLYGKYNAAGPTVLADDRAPSRPSGISVAVYPNPSNPSSLVEVILPHPGPITVEFHDMAGRLVERSDAVAREDRMVRVPFAAAGLSSGTYICTVRAGGWQRSVKLLVLR